MLTWSVKNSMEALIRCPQQESPGLAQALRKSCHLVLEIVTEELGAQVSEIDKG